MEFWKNVEGKVSSVTGIPAETIKVNLAKQEGYIIKYLAHACYPEHPQRPEIRVLKENIFSLYVSDIALLISKIEVYSHTLSSKSVEAVFNLLQYITAAELIDSESSQEIYYKKALAFTRFLKFSLQKRYFELLLDRLNTYRKMVKNYEHSGVLIEGKPFLSVVNSYIRQARQQYRSARSLHRKCVGYSAGVKGIYFDKIPDDVGFSRPVEDLEHVQELFVQYLPAIISNGYKRTFLSRFFFFLLDGLSIFFVLRWLWVLIP